MLYVKIHKSEGSEVIAVCDKELLGKTLKEGDMEIKISEEFYKGEDMTEEEITALLKEARNVNLIGEKSIALGIKVGIISEENILKIEGVPHAQAYSI